MGVVYRATHLSLERRVALKLLPDEYADDDRFRQRFIAESRAAASIDHPSIVPLYEAGEHDGRLFIATRLVDGCNLRDLIRSSAPLPPAQGLQVLGQIASALDAAHRAGLVHRDVKPANVLVADGQQHCYLTDFGLSKGPSTPALTRSDQFVGTAQYVSPEQIEGQRTDHRADVYALGCVLYEMLTGEPPFQMAELRTTVWAHLHASIPAASQRTSSLPPGIDEVFELALAKAPEERFQSCAALANAADAALQPSPLPASQNPRRKRSRTVRRTLVAATAVIGLTIGAAAGWLTIAESDRTGPAAETAPSPFAVSRGFAGPDCGVKPVRTYETVWQTNVTVSDGTECDVAFEVLDARGEMLADRSTARRSHAGKLAPVTGWSCSTPKDAPRSSVATPLSTYSCEGPEGRFLAVEVGASGS